MQATQPHEWTQDLRMQLSVWQNIAADAVKSWNWRLNSQKTIKQVFFITVPGTWGISPPNMRAKHPVISG